MAAAWSLYLSFGVILICSNCAFSEVTKNLAKKNDTNLNPQTVDRNVLSVTTELLKHSSVTMDISKVTTSSPILTAVESLGSESYSNRIPDVSEKNITSSGQFAQVSIKVTIPTANENQSTSEHAILTKNYTPSSISQSKELRIKAYSEEKLLKKYKKENDSIGLKNLDVTGNVEITTKKSIENQFSSRSIFYTAVAGSLSNTLKENISSRSEHKTLTHSTQPIKNDSSLRKRELSTTEVENRGTTITPLTVSEFFRETFKRSDSTETVSTVTSTAINQTFTDLPTLAVSPRIIFETPINSETTYNTDKYEFENTSTFDIDSLRKKFSSTFRNLTTNSSGRDFLSSYERSTVSIETTGSTDDKLTNTANPTEMTTVYDFTFSGEAVTERERPTTNVANNSTTRSTPTEIRLINISSSVSWDNYAGNELSTNYSNSTLGHTFFTPLPFKNITTNNTKINETNNANKEHLQFSGITLKVSHVLIPKQKRSRLSIQNMKIELSKNELLTRPSAPTPKNSNCTRFPVQVVTSSNTETKEKVNLTEEHYDCEYSPEINNTQKESNVSLHTFYGGYVFRYSLPKTGNSSISNQTSSEGMRSTASTTVDDSDDYYSSYMEYSDPTNGSSNSGVVEDGIFPDPDIRKKVPRTQPEALSVPLPDNSLTDSDLHDHDVIDSVMYIYFGGASHGQRGAGRQIIVVGAVIALVAQFLTLASSIRRIKTHHGEEPTIILLNIETALTLTNLIFILGVQSTSDHTICKITAVSLYYLHIVALFWFLLSSVYSVQTVCQIKIPFKFYAFCSFGWILPFITTLLSYIFNERSFETNLYCWVSPLRGILISYISPVILFCVICIILTIIGLKNVSDTTEDFDDTYSHKKLLRISAVALPLFSIIWFTGMVSLENSASLLFSLIFLISDTVLNWLLFACWLPSEASQWKDMDEDYYDEEEDFDDEPVLVKRRFDDQPLLSELYEYGAQGQLYNLRIEPISIISTP